MPLRIVRSVRSARQSSVQSIAVTISVPAALWQRPGPWTRPPQPVAPAHLGAGLLKSFGGTPPRWWYRTGQAFRRYCGAPRAVVSHTRAPEERRMDQGMNVSRI